MSLRVEEKEGLVSEERSDDALLSRALGGSRPKAVEGGCFPLQSLLKSFPKREEEQR